MKYICIRNWANRIKKDEIIEDWYYKKLPEEIKSTHFEIYESASKPKNRIPSENPSVSFPLESKIPKKLKNESNTEQL